MTDYHLACALRGLRQHEFSLRGRAGLVHDLPGKGWVWGRDLPDASPRQVSRDGGWGREGGRGEAGLIPRPRASGQEGLKLLLRCRAKVGTVAQV